ncbi:propanediol utilization protein PduB [Citrobacter koseri]|uniref:Propanediol utilization protein PduB n=1 Tax=Citrobacter koseri TaxID=545 RepID=A0A447UHC7_CITKO|nr:propanediol utilization protein PduB [Citrobacter koseri]
MIVGAPASVGVLMADTALKSANVEVVAYSSPAHGTSFSNEAILVISGDSGAVRQAVISAREIGKNRSVHPRRDAEKRSSVLHLISVRLIHEIEKI